MTGTDLIGKPLDIHVFPLSSRALPESDMVFRPDEVGAVVYEYRCGACDHIVRVGFSGPARSVIYSIMAFT